MLREGRLGDDVHDRHAGMTFAQLG
jgi:hypothetical protein